MTIQAELADGRVLEFPDGTSTEVIQKVVKRLISGETPAAAAPAQKGERTIGEAFTDTGAGLISGLGQLAQFPGQLYGLATGAIKDKDFATTGMQGVGKEMQDYAKTLKSAELKRREAETAKKVQEAEKTGGQLAALKTQLYESGTDPMQLGSFLAETLPASIPSIIAALIPGAGPGLAAEVKALQLAARAATTVAAKQAAEQALGVAVKEAAKSAVKRGTAASVGVGAVQQGTSVGAGAYKQVYDALIAQGVPPEQAAEETINKARAAGAAGAVISLLAQRLPGAQAMERALAGEKGKLGRVAGAVVGGVKESPSEIIEEVGGKGAQNVAARMVNPEQSLTEGLGATAAQAGLAGAGMGSIVGALQGRQAPEAVTAPPPPPGGTTGTQAPPPPPGGTQAPPPPPTAEQQARQVKVDQRTQELAQIIGNEEDAARIAEDEVAAEEAKIAELSAFNQRNVTSALAGEKQLRTVKDTDVRALATQFIDSGMEPEQAYATATQQIQEQLDNDALAQEQGALDVTGTKPTASRRRASVVSQPGAETPGGLETPARDGVVPAATDAGLAATGEAPQPGALGEGTNLGLTTIPYETVSFAGVGQPLQRSSGESNIIDHNGRKIVLVNVNGTQVPYYLSTGSGGKVDVPAGKWYPFFGVGSDGWINKTGGKEMADYYGSPALRDAAQTLDKQIGDIRNDDTHPRVSGTGPHIDAINAGFNPSENGMPGTLTTVRSNIDNLISKIERTTDGTQAAQTQQTETQEQEAPEATTPPAPVKETGENKISLDDSRKKEAELFQTLNKLEEEKQSLLSKDGRKPNIKSPNRARWDALGNEIANAQITWYSLSLKNDTQEINAGLEELTTLANELNIVNGAGKTYTKESLENILDTNRKNTNVSKLDYIKQNIQSVKDKIAQLSKQEKPNGTETVEAKQAETQKQEASAAPVTPAKAAKGDKHTTPQNAEGKWEHAINGEVIGTYDTKRQANAAMLLDKAKKTGNEELIAKNQKIFDAAMNPLQRGRPPKIIPFEPTTAETEKTKADAQAKADAEAIAKEDADMAAYDAKVAKVEGIARTSAQAAFDQVGDYDGDIDAAVDSYRQNTADTLVEEGFKKDPRYDRLSDAADRAFDAEVAKIKEKNKADANAKAKTEQEKNLTAEEKERLEELDDIYRNATNNPKTEGGKAAAKTLERVSKDTDEPRVVRERAKAMLSGSYSTLAIQASEGKKDLAFSTFTTSSQTLSHIIKTGTDFQKRLARRLRSTVRNVKMVVVEKGQELPSALSKVKSSWDRCLALYNTEEKVVYTKGESYGRTNGLNAVVQLHELFHGATSQKIRTALAYMKMGRHLDSQMVTAVAGLQKVMDAARAELNRQIENGTVDPHVYSLAVYGEALTNLHEFVSYGNTDSRLQEFLQGVKGFEKNTNLFSPFVDALRRLIGMGKEDATALSDLIQHTDQLISSRRPGGWGFSEEGALASAALPPEGDEDFDVPEAEIAGAVRSQKEVDRDVKKAEFKFTESAKAQQAAKGVSIAQMAQDPSKVVPVFKQMWNRASAALRRRMVQLPPTSFLVDWVAKEVPQLQTTYKLMQKMAGMTNGLLKSASELTNEVDRAFIKDPTLRDKLDKITSIATVAEVDPNTIDTAERSPVLDKLWRELGPEGQRIYKRIRNHFDGLSKYLSKLLDDQVTNSKLNIADQANLMKKIRAVFEQGGKINPYFALVREGDFWLAMNPSGSKKAEDYIFFMAETAAERDNVAREYATDLLRRGPNETDAKWNKRIDDKLGELIADHTFEEGNNIQSLRDKPYSQGRNKMLTDVFNAIDNTDLGSPEANSALKDSVYQAFLETMPDQAFRKQFIHRKGVAGFRVDVLRNTAHTSAKMATQLARIKYSPLLRNSLLAAEDSIKGRLEFEPFVDEMKERVTEALAPKQQSTASTVVNGLNKASFIYYLSGASSAMLQPLSIFQTGLPVLSRYGAFNAAKELAGMMKVHNLVGVYKTNADGTKSWVMPSMEYAKGLTPQQRRAYKAAEAMDLFTATQAGAVFNYKATPTDKLRSPNMKLAKGTVDALVFGGLMNTSERLSREAMFMASFNLNMKEHGNFSRAVDQAVMDTNAALGNYGEYARPAFMNGLGGKVLTQFMMYPLHTVSFLITNFKTMVAPMDGKDRAEAAQRFFGSLGTTFILAGAAGLPMFSTVMGMLGAAWGQMKDDDWPEEVRDMDFEFWFRTKCLDDLLGEIEIAGVKLSDFVDRGLFNAVTGLDIAGRTGWGSLFSRDTKETTTTRESAIAFALEHAGPSANMILAMADGYDAASQGDYAKAVKKWSPAGFRNFVNAHELATQGAKDNKGAELLSKDSFNTGLLIGQSIGFRSDLLANTQYVNFKVIGLEKRIQNERNQLLNNLDREYRNENFDAYGKYLGKIMDFNGRFPTYAITEDDVVDSLEKRAERRGTSWQGFVPTEKNVGLFSEVVLPSRLAADEAEKKAREK